MTSEEPDHVWEMWTRGWRRSKHVDGATARMPEEVESHVPSIHNCQQEGSQYGSTRFLIWANQQSRR